MSATRWLADAAANQGMRWTYVVSCWRDQLENLTSRVSGSPSPTPSARAQRLQAAPAIARPTNRGGRVARGDPRSAPPGFGDGLGVFMCGEAPVSTASAARFEVGARVGPYRIVGELGGGGM